MAMAKKWGKSEKSEKSMWLGIYWVNETADEAKCEASYCWIGLDLRLT